jgi:photosystem II stability/assembly factor-like uncharacterized protein
VVLDLRDPEVILAAAWQRRRHVFTLIGGGPESALYKSTDGGANWRKVTTGLPKEEMGRIGLAVSPADPDRVYALVEAQGKAGGTFRSTDRGETWEKRGDYVPGGPMYYQEIFADPKDPDRVYSVDVFMKVSDDGGKTFKNLGEQSKHVDNHVIWVDPQNNDHYLIGCDGGLYESFDRGVTWEFKANLPIAQFYRVAVDDALPIYNVYGGTQDNFSLGGPSRTLNAHGIANSDWFVTWGGDGFHTVADPKEPGIVYATLQYGVLSRFDRKSGESLLIQPLEAPGEPPSRWNWDSPLLISPHANTRLYFASERLWRSEDRGSSWKAVSGDLTQKLDRNKLKVMGQVWGADAVAKGQSTSPYGNIVSLDESPLQEGLLYVGTDDGLVQVSEDGGAHWRRQDRFPGVPDLTYVSELLASRYDPNVVYAGFNNHKAGDFKPYLLRSADRGKTWTQVAGDLPANGSVWTLVEDTADRDLWFAGTEFGLFFTKDGGRTWVKVKGLPTIAVRDLAVQKREGDLVIGTFGRGIYVLDDLSPLRTAKPADLETEALVFPVKSVRGFVPSTPLGLRGKSFQGESYYLAKNPPYGAVFTYYLKDEPKTRKKKRQEAEAEAEKKGAEPPYPSRADLVAESREEDPAVLLTVSDSEGGVVRRLTGPVKAGVQRVAWDLRYPPSTPPTLEPPPDDNPFENPPEGPLVVPGTYRVSVALRVDGESRPLGTPQSFEVEALHLSTLPPADRAQLLAFQKKVARLQRAVLGAIETTKEAQKRTKLLRKAIDNTPSADAKLAAEAGRIEVAVQDALLVLEGDSVMSRRNEPVPLAIANRVEAIVNAQWSSTSAPTGTSQQAYEAAATAFAGELEKLRTLVEGDLDALEAAAEAAGAPWTPGRLPKFTKE